MLRRSRRQESVDTFKTFYHVHVCKTGRVIFTCGNPVKDGGELALNEGGTPDTTPKSDRRNGPQGPGRRTPPRRSGTYVWRGKRRAGPLD